MGPSREGAPDGSENKTHRGRFSVLSLHAANAGQALEREVEKALDMVRTETIARQTRVAALQTEAQTLIGELPNPREELPLSLFEVTRLEEELSWNVDNISNIFRATQRKELERLLLVLERKDADDHTVQAVTVDKDKNEEQGEPSRSRWWHWW